VAAAERAQTDATLARVARGYHARVIEPVKSAKHGGEWISSLERLVPRALWQAPINSITAPVLLDAMIDLYRRVPETASRIPQRLDVIFADAQFHSVCLITVRSKSMAPLAHRFWDSFLPTAPCCNCPHGLACLGNP